MCARFDIGCAFIRVCWEGACLLPCWSNLNEYIRRRLCTITIPKPFVHVAIEVSVQLQKNRLWPVCARTYYSSVVYYAQACATKKTRSLANGTVMQCAILHKVLTQLVDWVAWVSINSMVHVMQSVMRAQPAGANFRDDFITNCNPPLLKPCTQSLAHTLHHHYKKKRRFFSVSQIHPSVASPEEHC